MKFQKVFIEKDVQNHPRVQSILQGLGIGSGSGKNPFHPVPIVKIEDVFGKVRKPYLQKRDNLNLFIGQKKGTLVKKAPAAYGTQGDPHYYFIHAYNCLYECEYCYLQGHFPSPDLVLFINHEDIGREISRLVAETPADQTPWFHAGEFSDSLALSHLTQEWPYYFDLFRQLPQARLELRTKSANIKGLLQMEAIPNGIVSFSLSPKKLVDQYDHKASPLKARLKAMALLNERGFPLAIHLDPIIYEENLIPDYADLLSQIVEAVPPSRIQYVSLGVVRFTKKVYDSVQKHYPESSLLTGEFQKSFDQKIRYGRPLRTWILNSIRTLCLEKGIPKEKIYLCMEN